MATHLIIISDREPLAWVLRTQRMAFPAGRAVTGLPAEGDRVLLYTTRGCYWNPTRDRGRIMGLAVVTSSVEMLPEPVVFGERRFTSGCTLRFEGLAPMREGLVLAELVPRLEAFPDPRSWSVRMRRASLPFLRRTRNSWSASSSHCSSHERLSWPTTRGGPRGMTAPDRNRSILAPASVD
ncbi:hypothetical protein [Streptomyces sp. NPDC050388]|uniref:hypothetical protein n=1 Tax=Streptomyces sp. NPDC050388 TaxID=3155781 RepID=UPI00341AA281